jgi:hypothetical protein
MTGLTPTTGAAAARTALPSPGTPMFFISTNFIYFFWIAYIPLRPLSFLPTFAFTPFIYPPYLSTFSTLSIYHKHYLSLSLSSFSLYYI